MTWGRYKHLSPEYRKFYTINDGIKINGMIKGWETYRIKEL